MKMNNQIHALHVGIEPVVHVYCEERMMLLMKRRSPPVKADFVVVLTCILTLYRYAGLRREFREDFLQCAAPLKLRPP